MRQNDRRAFRAINRIALMEVSMILHLHWPHADRAMPKALTALHDAPLGSLHPGYRRYRFFINNITLRYETIQAVAQHTRHRSHFT